MQIELLLLCADREPKPGWRQEKGGERREEGRAKEVEQGRKSGMERETR